MVVENTKEVWHKKLSDVQRVEFPVRTGAIDQQELSVEANAMEGLPNNWAALEIAVLRDDAG
jgi:hypothetical protein